MFLTHSGNLQAAQEVAVFERSGKRLPIFCCQRLPYGGLLIPYSRKIWWELYLAKWPPIGCK